MFPQGRTPQFECNYCRKGFERLTNFTEHQIKHLAGFDCPVPTCTTPHASADDLQLHLTWKHPERFLGGAKQKIQIQPVDAVFEPTWNISATASRESHHFQKITTTKTAQLENIEHFQPTEDNITKLFSSLVEQTVQDIVRMIS